jgi:hypothetical protein
LGDLAGGQMVRDQKRFTLFCDNTLTECRKAQDEMAKAGVGPRRKDVFYHLFKGKDPETGQGFTRKPS